MSNTTTFETGKTYTSRSIGDNDCVWNVKVLKRTAKFLTIKIDGEREVKRVGVSNYNGEEQCLFLGKYSMAPVIRASRFL